MHPSCATCLATTAVAVCSSGSVGFRDCIAIHSCACDGLQVLLPVAWSELLLRPMLAPLLLGRGLPAAVGAGAAGGWLSQGPLGTTLAFLVLLVNSAAHARGVVFGGTAPAYWLLSAMYLGEPLQWDTGISADLSRCPCLHAAGHADKGKPPRRMPPLLLPAGTGNLLPTLVWGLLWRSHLLSRRRAWRAEEAGKRRQLEALVQPRPDRRLHIRNGVWAALGAFLRWVDKICFMGGHTYAIQHTNLPFWDPLAQLLHQRAPSFRRYWKRGKKKLG